MKPKTKKNIAFEVLIFFSICAIILISTFIMMVINGNKKESYRLFSNQQENLILRKDSILTLPQNLNWAELGNSNNTWTPPKDALPMPPKPDLAYALKYSKNKKEIRKLIMKIEHINGELKELKPVVIYQKNLIILLILLSVFYILRPLFHLLIWAIRTIKE